MSDVSVSETALDESFRHAVDLTNEKIQAIRAFFINILGLRIASAPEA